MPVRGVAVEFQDVNVRVKDKVILKDVSGEALPGELLAIMGPSGSGKTTLLNVVAGRSVGTLTGSILMNKSPLTKKKKRKIAFVLQEDIFFEKLTARETLEFTANLRLPTKMSHADKLKKVDDIVETLDLRKCLDTKIGSSMDRGLSGGEKKRTNIGCELLNDPAVLVLDEPTTGLDSTTACNLIDMLQKYAARNSKTVITSIHQPSSQIFYKFDKLMLLSEGEVVYLGSSHDVMDYFSSINLECFVPHYNAADFILDKAKGTAEELDILHQAANDKKWETFNKSAHSISGQQALTHTPGIQVNGNVAIPAEGKAVEELGISSENETKTTEVNSDEITQQVEPSEEEAKPSHDASASEQKTIETSDTEKPKESSEPKKSETNGTIPSHQKGKEDDTSISTRDSDNDMDLDERWPSSWRTQFTTLTVRAFRQNFSAMLTKVDLLRHIILGTLFGIFYFQLSHEEDRLHDIRGVIFFGTVYWGFDSVFTVISTFPTERDVINKERASGMYRLSAYYLAKITSELPLMLIFPTIHFNLYYWLAGLNTFIGAYLASWSVLILNTLVGQSLGLAISAYSPDMSTAITFLAIYMLSSMMLGGFYVEILPFWLEWTQYLSFLFYSFNLSLRVEFNIRGDPTICAKNDTIFQECITGNATEVDGNTVLESMDILEVPVWANLVAMFGFLISFRLLAYYILKIKYKPK